MSQVGPRNPQVIFLTGAPLPSALNWSEIDLSPCLLPCFVDGSVHKDVDRPTAADLVPQWRSLPLHCAHLPTGLSQAGLTRWTAASQKSDDLSFLTATDLLSQASQSRAQRTDESRQGDHEDELSQYYEHSFAIHDGTDPPSPESHPSSDGISDDTWGSSFGSANDHANDMQLQAMHNRLDKASLSSLCDIPNASYLRSISPQTVSVDLIIGIISISRPRTIHTRRGQRAVDLVEIIVGDETRAGFAINIWLSPDVPYGASKVVSEKPPEELREQTVHLRPRDIVLAKNVALGSFKAQVHGQRLRRGVTTLDLLYRDVVDSSDHRGALRAWEIEDGATKDAKFAKMKRTKDWVSHFVGAARSLNTRRLTQLPEDTQ